MSRSFSCDVEPSSCTTTVCQNMLAYQLRGALRLTFSSWPPSMAILFSTFRLAVYSRSRKATISSVFLPSIQSSFSCSARIISNGFAYFLRLAHLTMFEYAVLRQRYRSLIDAHPEENRNGQCYAESLRSDEHQSVALLAHDAEPSVSQAEQVYEREIEIRSHCELSL